MKKCSKCGVEKPLAEFCNRADAPDGLGYLCKPCKATGEKEWRTKNPKRYASIQAQNYLTHHEERKKYGRERHASKTPEMRAQISKGVIKADLKRRYNLTPEDKAQMVLDQEGRCAICQEPFTRYSCVDHVHGSVPVAVRGLLCVLCNVGLGNFKDSPERLLKAVAYLKKFQK